jgi:hypothetical protein
MFIELTSHQGEKFLINSKEIIKIEQTDSQYSNCYVFYCPVSSSDSHMPVKETYEQIKELLGIYK